MGVKVAVIIASYNASKLIQGCIDNVAEQSYENIELIIMDGGSSDGTVDILQSNHKRISFWLSEQDDGIYDAWNKAIEGCSSDYLYFMGCDDRFANADVIKSIVESINTYSLAPDLVCGSVQMVNQVGENTMLLIPRLNSLPIIMLPHQGVFHSMKLFRDFGLFNHEYRIRGDFEFLIRCQSKRKLDIKVVPEIIGICELGGLSNDWKYAWPCFMETLRIYRLYSLSVINVRFIVYGVKSVVKLFLTQFRVVSKIRKMIEN